MLRFTIRDVLWLMVVVGMGCGWLIEHRVTSKRLRDTAHYEEQLLNCGKMLHEIVECIEAEGYTVETDTVRMYLERKSKPEQ